MKRINIKIVLLNLLCLVFFIANTNKAYSQRVVKIGEAEISIQSPISIKKSVPEEQIKNKPRFPRFHDESYLGFGTVVPAHRGSYLDMHYGRINSIEIGHNYFYRPVSGYAIGTFVQYSYYNYKLKDAAENEIFVENIPGEVRKEYFRTDNIGTGLINRFYFFPGRTVFKIDIGGYVDFAFSKRYNVKTIEDGKKEKHKYRDGNMFNPLQAGLYGAVSVNDYSVFMRYRITNLFNPEELGVQLPDLIVGVRFVLD